MTDLLYAFKTGDRVVKPKGYPFPGEVRAAFTNRAGEPRYVVELDGVSGLLHIFNGDQLRSAVPLSGTGYSFLPLPVTILDEKED